MMMENYFRQHIPNFVSGVDASEFAFSDMAELLAHPLIKRWADDPGFSHFAISDNHLMQIADDGFRHWVIGYIKHPKAVDLPKWAGWKFRALLDGQEVVLSDEVTSSCGDVLTLRDGRKATNLRYSQPTTPQEGGEGK